MTFSTKRIVLFFLALTLMSLVLLSASLSNLQLHAGAPFPGGGNSDNDIHFFTELTPTRTYSFTILKGIFSLIFLILMIYVPARLIALVDIKKAFQLLLAMVVLLVIVNLIPRVMPDQPAHLPSESSGMTTPPSFYYPVTPLGKPPQGLIQLVLIGFMFGAGLLAMKVLKPWLRPTRIEDQLAQEAEFAVNAIKAGEDMLNVIIRCYLQMTRSLQEERGIERSYNMTVREFEDWLELKGVPPIPVRQLTYLFEKVRYGKSQLSENDEKIGIESLNEIIKYCRKAKDLSK